MCYLQGVWVADIYQRRLVGQQIDHQIYLKLLKMIFMAINYQGKIKYLHVAFIEFEHLPKIWFLCMISF